MARDVLPRLRRDGRQQIVMRRGVNVLRQVPEAANGVGQCLITGDMVSVDIPVPETLKTMAAAPT